MIIRLLKYGVGGLMAALLVMAIIIESQYKEDIPVNKLLKDYRFEESTFLSFDGADVHYTVKGNGPNLVLVHGFGGNLRNWRAWQEMLADSFRVISMDLPGYGLTGPTSSGNYSDSAQVVFLSAFVDSLALTDFYLAGNSMGGSIAWRYALKYPEKVTKLVLVNSSGYPEKAKNKSTPIGFKILQNKTLSRLMTKVTPESLIRKTLLNTYANDSLVTDVEVASYMNLLLREGNREALVKRAGLSFARNDTLQIATLSMPTLIMWGDQDKVIDVDASYRFERDIPTNQLIIYKGIGHLPMYELPAQSSQDLRLFLRK